MNFLFVFCIMSNGFAQDMGVAKFYVDTENGYFEITLNDTFLLKKHQETLPVGKYHAKIWSPGYAVFELDFQVVKGEVTNCEAKMKRSEAYMVYEKEYRDYRMQFHKQFSLPLSISIASTLSTGYFMLKGYDVRKTVIADIDLYSQAVLVKDVDQIKLRIAENNRKYDQLRTAFYINSGISLLCIGGTIFSAVHFKKNYKEPTYFKESPFKERFSFHYGVNSFNLTYHL